MAGVMLPLFFSLNILCSLVHFTYTDVAIVNISSTAKHVTSRKTTSHHHPTTHRPTTRHQATHHHTTHHATQRHTTHHPATPRPTPEHVEQSATFYHYDRNTHYICGYHSSRHAHYCLCYHVPYEHRVDMHSPLKLLETEKHMFELYTVGHHVLMDDLQFYSKFNYDKCHAYGKRPNVTTYLVYDNN
ncbi:histidine-rich glycoprotein-like [Ostrea edulis]|uniref:histidine-rich glycoprotein-like n=1 Tax=Ostrea edulis TaxID=37623 RepID=UPI0024AF2590|nr:histidine-rich glycoprotein-like [Ostrea edulis]